MLVPHADPMGAEQGEVPHPRIVAMMWTMEDGSRGQRGRSPLGSGTTGRPTRRSCGETPDGPFAPRKPLDTEPFASSRELERTCAQGEAFSIYLDKADWVRSMILLPS
jgi:hypothetical protein